MRLADLGLESANFYSGLIKDYSRLIEKHGSLEHLSQSIKTYKGRKINFLKNSFEHHQEAQRILELKYDKQMINLEKYLDISYGLFYKEALISHQLSKIVPAKEEAFSYDHIAVALVNKLNEYTRV